MSKSTRAGFPQMIRGTVVVERRRCTTTDPRIICGNPALVLLDIAPPPFHLHARRVQVTSSRSHGRWRGNPERVARRESREAAPGGSDQLAKATEADVNEQRSTTGSRIRKCETPLASSQTQSPLAVLLPGLDPSKRYEVAQIGPDEGG